MLLMDGVKYRLWTPKDEEKSKDFKTWLEQTYPREEERQDYLKKHFIPQDINLSFGNFKEFFEERNKLILQEFIEILP